MSDFPAGSDETRVEADGAKADGAQIDPQTDSLAAALARHGVSLSSSQQDQLERYCRLLWDWNERLNLTRHTDFERFVSRDVLDSRHLADQLEAGETVLDFGTGGGVPGVVVAILRPDVRVTLCESVGKKAHAVESIVHDLGLDVPVYANRLEQLLDERRFDVVMARAVGSLSDVCRWIGPRWPALGRLLLVKGPKWPEERGEARHRGYLKGIELRVVDRYPMPGTEAESVILRLRKPA